MERIFFVGDTPCCQNKANPVSHRTPPPPWISPPPLPTKTAHAVPILHLEFVLEEICHRGGRFAIWYYSLLGKFCHRISSGGGGGGKVCHMVLFPPGEVLLWDFFRGKVCHKVFLHGERLPYGIISEGFVSLSRNVCVCGGGGG